MSIKVDKEYIKDWIKNIQDKKKIGDLKKGGLDINIKILFFDKENKPESSTTMKNLCFTKFSTKADVEESMFTRLSKAYSPRRIENYEIQDFNLIENNDHTYYFCNKKRYKNLIAGINYIKNNTSTADFNKERLRNSVCLAVEYTYDQYTDIGFFGIQNFNSLKNGKSKLWKGFMGNVVSNCQGNSILKVDDKDLIFGVGPKLDAVFISKDNIFLINPQGKTTFENTFLLKDEYKNIAKSEANYLQNYSTKLLKVSSLATDFYLNNKNSTPMLDRMLAKMSEKKYRKKLRKLLNDDEKWKKRLMEIEDFKNEKKFKKKFKDLSIDSSKGTIAYSKKSVFSFVAVLSDRPKESILLEEKELGS